MTQICGSFLLYHCFGQRTNDDTPGYRDKEKCFLSEGHGVQRQRGVNLPHDRRHTVVHPVDIDGCQLSEAMASEASPVPTQQDVLHVEGHPEERDLRAVWNSSEFVPVGES